MNRLVFSLGLLLAAPAFAEVPRYIVQLDTDGAVATVTINGIPVASKGAVGGSAATVANPYLKRGANVLHVHVRPQSGTEHATYRVEIGTREGKAFYSRTATRDTKAPPIDEDVALSLPDFPDTPMWHASAQQGDVAQPVAEVLESDRRLLEAAVKKRDAAAVVAVDVPSSEQMAQSLGNPALKSMILEGMKEALHGASGAARSKPVVGAELHVEPVAGTSLYRVSRKDGAPVLLVPVGDGGGVGCTNPIVGKSDRGWTVFVDSALPRP